MTPPAMFTASTPCRSDSVEAKDHGAASSSDSPHFAYLRPRKGYMFNNVGARGTRQAPDSS